MEPYLLNCFKNSISGPSIQPGRHGNSVHFPNMQSSDENALTLATIGTCLEKIEKCSDGITLAFWAKAPQNQSSQYFYFLASSSVTIFTNPQPTGFRLRFLMQETAEQRTKYSSDEIMEFDQWHFVAVTYSVQLGPEFFLNGNLLQVTVSAPKSYPRDSLNLVVGCYWNYKFCMNGNVDDLKFWTKKKDKNFVQTLWSS